MSESVACVALATALGAVGIDLSLGAGAPDVAAAAGALVALCAGGSLRFSRIARVAARPRDRPAQASGNLVVVAELALSPAAAAACAAPAARSGEAIARLAPPASAAPADTRGPPDVVDLCRSAPEGSPPAVLVARAAPASKEAATATAALSWTFSLVVTPRVAPAAAVQAVRAAGAAGGVPASERVVAIGVVADDPERAVTSWAAMGVGGAPLSIEHAAVVSVPPWWYEHVVGGARCHSGQNRPLMPVVNWPVVAFGGEASAARAGVGAPSSTSNGASAAAAAVGSASLFVAGLNLVTTSADLRGAFEAAAGHLQVVRATVKVDPETGKSLGYGFVQLATVGQCDEAFEIGQSLSIDDKVIRVDFAHGERPGSDRKRKGKGKGVVARGPVSRQVAWLAAVGGEDSDSD